jgi:hypothetical protein
MTAVPVDVPTPLASAKYPAVARVEGHIAPRENG